jgi:hypothetical protein
VTGQAGGSGADPDRGHPWVNLGGGGWPNTSTPAGASAGSATAPARVTVRSVNGATLSDDVVDRTVLFLAPPGQPIEPPVRVELRSVEGELLAEHGFIE